MELKSTGDNRKRKPSGAAVVRRELTVGLYRALFEEWAGTGYTGISLERVVVRAGFRRPPVSASGYQRISSNHADGAATSTGPSDNCQSGRRTYAIRRTADDTGTRFPSAWSKPECGSRARHSGSPSVRYRPPIACKSNRKNGVFAARSATRRGQSQLDCSGNLARRGRTVSCLVVARTAVELTHSDRRSHCCSVGSSRPHRHTACGRKV